MKKNKKLNIAIVGLGNIGLNLYRHLEKNKKSITEKNNINFEIKYVSAKNKNKKRKINIPKKKWLKNYLLAPRLIDVDVVVELIGGSEGPAKKLVFNSLKNKKHVITANKALISKYGDELALLAERKKVNLEFEAAVAGGIPVLRTIKDGLATNNINKVVGILNGTSNYILSQMENSNKSFKEVLTTAKSLGYAESNPKNDLDGNDVLSKIRILSSLSFNTKISKNICLMDGIENIELKDIKIAKQLDLRIKLLGITELVNNKLFERVHPCLVKKDTYIGNVSGVMNAVITKGVPVGESILQGEGAGPGPTSSALMSDLLSILRGNIKYPFGISDKKRKKVKVYNINNYSNALYLRLEVKDKPGVLSSITKQLAKYNISVKRLIQIPDHKKKTASIAIITHEANELNSKKCLKSFKVNKNVIKPPVLIRLF